jgi:hypothetical protein
LGIIEVLNDIMHVIRGDLKKETSGRNFTRTKIIPTTVICALLPPTSHLFWVIFFGFKMSTPTM